MCGPTSRSSLVPQKLLLGIMHFTLALAHCSDVLLYGDSLCLGS
jgi:hypothetical protein